ncbi:MAG: hypothetical protein QM214_06695 [Bacillota bacterium]|jgi:hypothetical protein|nr:hypothetical protein [Bacillota bacterium]HHU43100.1 hypothetical protein [Clostridiales bacterium]
MENICQPKPVKMLMVIVDRGKGKKIIKMLNDFGLGYTFAAYGTGTASTEIRTYFGLEESQRDIVFGIVPQEKSKDIMDLLNEKLKLRKPNTGIAFTIPIKCVSSMLALKYMLEQ